VSRREFITLLGGTVIAWPLAAGAQQPAMPVIGVLDARSPGAIENPLRAFRQGLKDSSYVEGENVAIEYRWADNQLDRLPALAAEFVRRRATVIAAIGPVTVFPTKAATTTIPIVFIINEDPVRLGLVASLARPGGNLTGINVFSAELAAKRLELLRELVPAITRVAVLVNPADATNTESTLRDVAGAARTMGCKSRFSTPAAAARSTRPSRRLRARGPTRFSSAPVPSSTAGVCNWQSWRHATRSPRHYRTVTLPKPAG
jgi:putative ABC transport system substrate-binding protein